MGTEEAFQNGRVVGNVAGFAVDAVLTVGGISGVITGVRAIQSASGLIKVAQVVRNGELVNVVMANGQAVIATAETLASLGVSAEAARNLGENLNNMMMSNPPGGSGGSAPSRVQVAELIEDGGVQVRPPGGLERPGLNAGTKAQIDAAGAKE